VAGPPPPVALPWRWIPVAVTGRGAPAPPDEPRRGVRPSPAAHPCLAYVDLSKADATKARRLHQLLRWRVRTAGELLDWGRGESRGWIEEAELREEERSRWRGGGGEEMTAGGGEEERPGPTPDMWGPLPRHRKPPSKPARDQK
jgi:hypothetical protein